MRLGSNDLASTAAGFNAVDWALLVILAWSVITAFLRGLIRELFAIAGLFLGLILAGLYYLPLAVRLRSIVTQPAVREIAAFLLIAFGIMLLAGILGRLLHRTVSLVGLGFLDRLAGALFGWVRGCLVCVALITAAKAFLPPLPALRNSHLTPYFLAGAHGVSFVVPQQLQQQIAEGVARIRQSDQAR